MPTLANTTQRDAIIDRVERLAPDAVGQWGKLTAPQMLAHCADALRMGLGELPCKPKHVPIARLAITKWLFFNVLPFPKDAPTARELIARTPSSWEEERARLVSLIRQVGGAEGEGRMADHPLFGPLTRRQWGQLAWKHLDHHLRQFGG